METCDPVGGDFIRGGFVPPELLGLLILSNESSKSEVSYAFFEVEVVLVVDSSTIKGSSDDV